MANRLNRYRSMYEAIPRANNSDTFPKHVFMRAQNLHTNLYDRIGDR